MDFFDFVRSQRTNLPIVPKTCENQVIIITGSNSGIGFEAAKHFVRLNAARVILAVRSQAKGLEAKRVIEEQTAIKDIAEVWELDMSSFESIKIFVHRTTTELERVDVVIENAAAALDRWTEAEGMETSVAVNVVGTMLLAVLLLPKMKATAIEKDCHPHLVVVTSERAFSAGKELNGVVEANNKIFDTLNVKQDKLLGRYEMTKMLQFYAFRELAARCLPSQSRVVINLLSPGLCKTNLTQYASRYLRVQVAIFNYLFARSAEMGSRTLLYAAVAGLPSHGQFLSECEIKDHWVPRWVKSSEGERTQKVIFEQVRSQLQAVVPGCTERALDLPFSPSG